MLALGQPRRGLRSYVAVRGGIGVPPVLGSRSTDTLSGLGPPPVAAGALLPVGDLVAEEPVVDVAPVWPPPDRPVLRVLPGPRRDWLTAAAWVALTTGEWRVAADSDRVGLRLTGPRLDRDRHGELPSEGLLPGAVQVPPDGVPVLFLADHPVDRRLPRARRRRHRRPAAGGPGDAGPGRSACARCPAPTSRRRREG